MSGRASWTDIDVEERVRAARRLLNPCWACARACQARRLEGELGFCQVGSEMVVASAGPHFGEEPPLVGRGGSGTIFLSGCNLDCVFCQNYDISHAVVGRHVDADAMADLMLALEDRGCHNVNFVSPSHVGPQLLEAIVVARRRGLTVPIVWNCGGYESLEMLGLLDGLVDIYMPDIKYADDAVARRLSSAPGYVSVVRQAVKEMHRQVGDLEIRGGIARRGLLVRHLVLPNDLAGTRATLDFLADEVSPNTYVNVMGQYRPEYRAGQFPEIARRPTSQELEQAWQYARQRGLRLAR